MQKGAQTMSITESQNLSIHQLCEAIDLLDTCMDDYLYVYDFENESGTGLYSFDDEIPVCVYPDLSIKISELL